MLRVKEEIRPLTAGILFCTFYSTVRLGNAEHNISVTRLQLILVAI